MIYFIAILQIILVLLKSHQLLQYKVQLKVHNISVKIQCDWCQLIGILMVACQ